LKILGSVSISGSGGGIAASSHGVGGFEVDWIFKLLRIF
jgi:hypothetical protein